MIRLADEKKQEIKNNEVLDCGFSISWSIELDKTASLGCVTVYFPCVLLET